MNPFASFGQQWKQFVQNMSLGRRIGFLATGVLAAAAILAIGYWASQPDYRVLYTGLSAEDGAAITAKLQGQGVSFKLAAGGTAILAPADQVQQLRLDLAADGLPMKAGKGFEILDNSPLGATPWNQHVNFIRALQGELARTIMQIEPVVFARVHIVKPDPTPFVRDQKPTTASVVLKLKPGTTLNRNVAAGIVALVARSVEGLAKESVTLVDTNGRVLSEEHDPDTGLAGTQMDFRRDLENYLSSRAETMLSSVVGPGRALVRVTADINFQRHREKKETYQPEGRVATSEKITTTKSTSASPGARGVTGTTSNLGKGGGPANPPGGNNNQEETIQTDFAVSKVTQEYEDKLGSIERLTIAALVDLSSVEKEGKTESPINLAEVQEILKQAVGFKKGRDEIKVTDVKLSTPTAPMSDDEWQSAQNWQQIVSVVRNASLGVAALAALGMGWMVLRRMGGPVAASTVTESPERKQVLEKLSASIEQDPQALAGILATWLDRSETSRRKAA
ncbi:MAG: flagellar M-ring protein FliF [Planctomycetes bacterium]|nr:flagellar M-ring protein FliF [Planctomycetota bacterium]